MRAEVAELAKSLSEEEDADGIPLVRWKGGLAKLGSMDAAQAREVRMGGAWVLDAWGQPIVLIQDTEGSGDWCLASAGADGAWTTDGELHVMAGKQDREELCARAPTLRTRHEPGPLQVVGDDIVLHSSGTIARRYSFPIPQPSEVALSACAALRGTALTRTKVSEAARHEMAELSAAERESIAKRIASSLTEYELTEDTWSREDTRREGLLPRLWLRVRGADRGLPPIWIDPEKDGWTIDVSCEELMEEPKEEESAQPAPAGSVVSVFGQTVEAENISFCVDVSEEARRSPGWQKAYEGIVTTISRMPNSCTFAIVTHDKSSTIAFPESKSTLATEEAKARAISTLESCVNGSHPDGSEGHAAGINSALEQAFSSVLERGIAASTRKKAMVYVGSACGYFGQDEMLGLRMASAAFLKQNWQRIRPLIFAVGVPRGSIREQFLQDLSRSQNGAYRRLDE